jgi:hypothetical protein
MTDSTEIDRLRADNAAMVGTLRAIDRAATENAILDKMNRFYSPAAPKK